MSADWALNNMERQLNFGHLAIHRTAEVSKAIIGSYYGTYPKYSYFFGCSRGGGQAMMEAQRYPDDFDGIVAGAPAFYWTAPGSRIRSEYTGCISGKTDGAHFNKRAYPPFAGSCTKTVRHDRWCKRQYPE